MSNYDISIKKGPIHFSTNNHELAIAAILTLEGKVNLQGDTGDYKADFSELEQQTLGQPVRAETGRVEPGPPEGFGIGQPAPDGHGGIVIGYIGGDAVVMGEDERGPVDWAKARKWCELLNDSSGEPGWVMPSEDELDLAWEHREVLKGLGMAETWYWSSTQGSAISARLQYFSGGYKNSTSKSNGYRVRPVRRLKI